ncbi:unnamed protein product [Porites evermanni]|uniref:Uncharacterized protein n=1 Tax=Porites evermanni TaxID=104178 RepID=A0ABN8R7U5_9CNID|nr:unnamed protein product [Porites evermanni]
MVINDKKIKFQIDCEASINIITRCNTRKSHITPSNKTLKMWNGTEIKPLGTTSLKVTNPKTGKQYSIEIVVVPDDLTPLLGARTAQQMELITVVEDHFVSVPPPQKTSCEDIRSIATADKLVRRYPEVFARYLGTLPGTVQLRVDENAEPSITPSYGRHVKIQSDHKPLESILKKSLVCTPKCLQGMMMRRQKYD